MSKKIITHKLIVVDIEEKVRVDKYLSQNIEGISRSLVGDKDTLITIDGKAAKNSAKVAEGAEVEIQYIEYALDKIEGQDIEIKTLYEDESILVINKDQGLVVHPGAGNFENTLVNALVFKYGDKFQSLFVNEDTKEEDSIRPGIVHRLDKDTSGVMVVALNKEVQLNLIQQFKDRTPGKIYIALVKGHFKKRRGRITDNIIRDPKNRKKYTICEKDMGKTAETSYLVLRQYRGYALVRLNLHTGRTHQIRVHLNSINHPILGDPVYSSSDKTFKDVSMMLHALQLEINHPTANNKMRFRAPMPQRFKETIKQLELFVMDKGQKEKYYESAEKLKLK